MSDPNTATCPHCGKVAAEHTPAESMEHMSIFFSDPTTSVGQVLAILLGQIAGLAGQVQQRPANPASKRMVTGALSGIAFVINDGIRRIKSD